MLSSHRGHNVAIHAERRGTDGRDRRGFRPVALPALAAAVHVSANAMQTARASIAAGNGRRFVHEDEPSE